MKLREIPNRLLALIGLKLSRLSEKKVDGGLGFVSVCERLRHRGLEIETVIDVGASNGCWSKKLMPFFPRAYFFLIEANRHHEPELLAFKKNHPSSDYALAVAGDKVGEVFFDKSDPFCGVASHTKSEKFNTRLRCVTIDDEVAKRKLKGPYLLKLDTHGFEVPIFEGADKTLKKTNLIFVETYNFDIEETSLRFWEMCQYLYERGFRPIDLCEPMHRPADEAFWQIDILFVRNDREEFKSNNYD